MYTEIQLRLHRYALASKSLDFYKQSTEAVDAGRPQLVDPVTLNLDLSEEDAADAVSYFNETKCYASHVPKYATRQLAKPDFGEGKSAYFSYGTEEALRCEQIMKALNSAALQNYLEEYLGENAIMYSINTFWTLPKIKALTHGFHRDEDGFRTVAIFVFWTKTSIGDGHFETIPTTGEPRSLTSIFGGDAEDFYNSNVNSTNGYDNDKKYEKLDLKSELLFGEPGSSFAFNPWSLHRGSPVKKPRLVTWFRFADVLPFSYYNDGNRMRSRRHDPRLLQGFNDKSKQLLRFLI